ncbi:MAG TPA: methyltransferase domain-containing protein [Hyphomicrobiales bacterium]|nr:methyltransferase domain-containing protein [Hyphomicrobiales bacterium]
MSGSNVAEIAEWNGSRGKAWLARHELVNRQITPFGRRAMEKLMLRPGEHVLDIGCGCGEPTIELARAVGPAGRATGIDGSRLLLEEARAMAAREGVANASFIEGDAATYTFPPAAAGALFSRFGVMFFADPEAAFRNLRDALKSDGRLAFVCWRTPAENRFITLPITIAQRFAGNSGPRTDPEAPGPFAFADPDRIRRILAAAGFTGIAIEPSDEKMGGGTLDQAVATITQSQPFQKLLAESDAGRRAEIDTALREAMAPHVTPDGVVFDAGAWIVSARNP